jgi:cyclopropane fatty-acyl-phospholipid synthase-like methyltransferase
MPVKPYAGSCDQNRVPIFSVIQPVLENASRVLEIGSGTGQHAVYFAARMPHLIWQTSDLAENHEGIRLWLESAKLENALSPILLDTATGPWPDQCFDAVFTANSLHIMHDDDVAGLFGNIGRCLEPGADMLIYGPFNYNGQFTSDSNARFDQWLKSNDPGSGIKDFEGVNELAGQASMRLVFDYAMPANNRILHFRKNRE